MARKWKCDKKPLLSANESRGFSIDETREALPPALAVSIHLRPGGDVVVQHQQVQLFFTVFVVNGGDQHSAGLNAHHGTGRQIGDGKQRLAHQLFRLIISMNVNHSYRVL